MLRSFRLRKVLLDDATELNQALTSAASCPNLLDCIDGEKPVGKGKNKKSRPKRFKKRNTTSIIDTTRMTVAISSVEAEDIGSLEFQSEMLSRGSRQRSQSLDRVSDNKCRERERERERERAKLLIILLYKVHCSYKICTESSLTNSINIRNEIRWIILSSNLSVCL